MKDKRQTAFDTLTSTTLILLHYYISRNNSIPVGITEKY